MLFMADRAGGINIVAFDVESKAEFFEIKHFCFLSAALRGRFPIFRRAGGVVSRLLGYRGMFTLGGVHPVLNRLLRRCFLPKNGPLRLSYGG